MASVTLFFGEPTNLRAGGSGPPTSAPERGFARRTERQGWWELHTPTRKPGITRERAR